MGEMNDFFNGFDADGALRKALTAGTLASPGTGGALLVEDCEETVKMVASEMADDFKLCNGLQKVKAKSTTHQFITQDVGGQMMEGFVPEGDDADGADSEFVRETVKIASIGRVEKITQEMMASDTYDNIEARVVQGLAVANLRTQEWGCFHGDADVVPSHFNGIPALIRKARAAGKPTTLIDMRGASVASKGTAILDDTAIAAAELGGMVNKAFYPVCLAAELQALLRDKERSIMGDKDSRIMKAYTVAETVAGPVEIAGEGAGMDKCYKPKGRVTAFGPAGLAPLAPTSVTVSAAAAEGSKFAAADAGAYAYAVHAINRYGVSAGVSPSAAATVAAGQGVTITITPAANDGATGFIVCRSAKDGTEVMEMCRIAKGSGATTVCVDLNDDLPGTAEMLFITERKFAPIVYFAELFPPTKYTDKGGVGYAYGKRFSPVAMYWAGAVVCASPKMCALVKNIGYHGGLY